jgi:hypothetical protein|tara:strand:- start:74 stop:928 length:855 start_codon:yes stop_codon:yes gene_type:complete
MMDENMEAKMDMQNDAADPNAPEDEKNLLGGMPDTDALNPFAEKPYVPSDASDPDKYNLSPCCCCLCACSHDRVGDASCFGCLPIKCGVMVIAFQIFALSITLICVTFFELLNEYLPWWYCFVMLLLLIPIAITASIIVYFFGKDKRSTRSGLFGGIIMAIISTCLWCTWKLIFYLAIYKKDVVYTGMGAANDETNYHSTPKRTYLFWVLAETVCILAWLMYSTCVVNQYVNLMNAHHERREEAEKVIQDQKDQDDKKAAEEKALADKHDKEQKDLEEKAKANN